MPSVSILHRCDHERVAPHDYEDDDGKETHCPGPENPPHKREGACPLCTFYGNHAPGCLVADLEEEIRRLHEEVIWPAVDHQHDAGCSMTLCPLCIELDNWADLTGWTPHGEWRRTPND